jgi:RecA-family ATPase
MTRLLNIPEYLQLERDELGWIVPGLLAKPSTTLILGGPKAGKSYLALALALAIAHGQQVFGRPSQPSRVLMLQFDTSHGVWAEMISKVVDEGHQDDGHIYHARQMNLFQIFQIVL